MRAYLLGLLTLPALAVATLLLMRMTFTALVALERRGVTFQMRWRRDPDSISEYTLQHNIWWERQLGPAFAGGWYREEARFEQPDERRINRWIGIGSRHGPCFTVFLSRYLGPVT